VGGVHSKAVSPPYHMSLTPFKPHVMLIQPQHLVSTGADVMNANGGC
jgi:hypothetical protein